jgi:hypothetical protein
VTHDPNRDPLAVALLAFLVVFALTRLYTREARVRGWGSANVGGVHIHHALVGIILVLGAGTLIIGFQPTGAAFLMLSAFFGAGAAFILDEFALILHLQDVYWQTAGRSSIDAVAIALIVGAVVLLHIVPLDLGDANAGRWTLVAYVSLNLVFVVITAAKGKLVTALVGIFFPFVAFVGAARLAKPDSIWDRRFYPTGGRRHRRTRARYALQHRRWSVRRTRLEDLVGGRPTNEADRPQTSKDP